MHFIAFSCSCPGIYFVCSHSNYCSFLLVFLLSCLSLSLSIFPRSLSISPSPLSFYILNEKRSKIYFQPSKKLFFHHSIRVLVISAHGTKSQKFRFFLFPLSTSLSLSLPFFVPTQIPSSRNYPVICGDNRHSSTIPFPVINSGVI